MENSQPKEIGPSVEEYLKELIGLQVPGNQPVEGVEFPDDGFNGWADNDS